MPTFYNVTPVASEPDVERVQVMSTEDGFLVRVYKMEAGELTSVSLDAMDSVHEAIEQYGHLGLPIVLVLDA